MSHDSSSFVLRLHRRWLAAISVLTPPFSIFDTRPKRFSCCWSRLRFLVTMATSSRSILCKNAFSWLVNKALIPIFISVKQCKQPDFTVFVTFEH